MVYQKQLPRGLMNMRESLETYRSERRSFIVGLKNYFGIDFYQMDKIERAEWLRIYMQNRREFLYNLYEHWKDFPPEGKHAERIIKKNLRR
jgi:hypothetical protein